MMLVYQTSIAVTLIAEQQQQVLLAMRENGVN